MLPVVRADFALERFHRSGFGTEGFVIPSFNGREPEQNPFAGNRVAPLFGSQFLELRLKLPALRRRSQKRSNNAEAKMRPALMRPRR